MASKGGKPIQLTFGGGDQPLESADENVVYYVKQLGETKNEVWKVPVSGGDEGRVLGPVNAFRYSISVVPQGVYFVELGTILYVGSSGNSLKFYSFASSTTETVADVRLNPNSGLSISPDGRYALMTLLDPDVCDLMVVDNFR
jgi:DNA-binding beta-propeller fold protein YncE